MSQPSPHLMPHGLPPRPNSSRPPAHVILPPLRYDPNHLPNSPFTYVQPTPPHHFPSLSTTPRPSPTALLIAQAKANLSSNEQVHVITVKAPPPPKPPLEPSEPPVTIGPAGETIFLGPKLITLPKQGETLRQAVVSQGLVPQFIIEAHPFVRPVSPLFWRLSQIIKTMFLMARMRQENRKNANRVNGQMRLIGFRPGTDKGFSGGELII